MGFKETFTRSGEQEQNLQYDDTAFLYFSLSFLIIILIPLIYDLICRVYLKENIKSERIKNDKSLVRKNKQICKIERKDYISKYLFLRIIVILVLLILLVDNIEKVRNIKVQLKSFDAYETLEISNQASLQEIKKAYRRLSLIYHPDKNPDDPLSTAKFIQITKAYNCLTDEEMKAMCEKYGNPDGPGSFSVAVALPSFLLHKDNHVLVLIIFCILIIIVIPTIVYLWYTSTSEYDQDGILFLNKQNYYKQINENTLFKQITEILSTSIQYLQYPVLDLQESHQLQKIQNILIDQHNIIKPKLEINQMKPFLLINAHMLGIKLEEKYKEQQYRILKTSQECIKQLITFASKLPPNIKDIKYCGLRCINTLIDFQQNLCQGVYQNSLEIEQLEFFNEERLELVKKKVRKIPTIKQIQNNDESCEKLYQLYSEEEQKQIKDEVQNYPQLNIKHNVEVEDENDIVEGDVVTIKIEIFKMNLIGINEDINNEKTKLKLKKINSDYVHNPNSPVLCQDGVHIILSNDSKNVILFMKHIPNINVYSQTRIQYRAPCQGVFNWKIQIRSDSYKGLDIEIPLEIKILSQKQLKRDIFVHPEDLALDREPSFMQSLLIGAGIEVSDDELEDQEQKVQNTKSQIKKQQHNHVEVKEDEEEEEEEEELEEGQISFKK